MQKIGTSFIYSINKKQTFDEELAKPLFNPIENLLFTKSAKNFKIFGLNYKSLKN